MKPHPVPVLLGCLLLLVGVGAVLRREATSLSTPRVTPPPSAPAGADARERIESDPAIVFQRAFWRRPGPDVRVLEAERREIMDTSAGPGRWQWFLALESTPEFRAWLLDGNPFDLVGATAPDSAAATAVPLDQPPAWFPAADDLPRFTLYRNHEGSLRVFVDPANGRIYATDAGGGFTAARRPLALN